MKMMMMMQCVVVGERRAERAAAPLIPAASPHPLPQVTEKLLEVENETMMKVADLEKLLLQKDKDLHLIRVSAEKLSIVTGEVIRKQDASLPLSVCGVIACCSLSPPGDRLGDLRVDQHPGQHPAEGSQGEGRRLPEALQHREAAAGAGAAGHHPAAQEARW